MKLRISRFGIIVVFMLGLSAVISFFPYREAVRDSTPDHSSDGWRVSAPVDEGMDGELLAKGAKDAAGTDITNLIVVRNGSIVMEKYYRGQRPKNPSYMAQATNSIISALVGIAIENGYISGIDRKVIEYFPEYSQSVNPAIREITIGQLLTMTSGFGEPPDELYHSTDWIKYQLGLPLYSRPGEQFRYAKGTTYLLSAVLTKATGMSARDFAVKFLFGSIKGGQPIWHTGPEGYNTGGDYLFIKPLDLAKFGCLYLDGGKWEGKQVIPAGWVAESLKPQAGGAQELKASLKGDVCGFGYNFIIRKVCGYNTYWVEGNGENANLCIIPDLDMVVVATSYHGWFKSSFSYEDMERILSEFIIPAVSTGDGGGG